MSGTVDPREEDHVPQFYGRIDEKFAEWDIDVKEALGGRAQRG